VFETKIHVFDCDGVLLDSNSLKLMALRETLQDLGSPAEFIVWALEDFRSNFGRTRIEHFKNFSQYDGVMSYKLPIESASYAMKSYGKKVESLYKSCPVVAETQSYVNKITCTNNLYVVSASDEQELKRVLPSRIPQFTAARIFGGPVKKSENLQIVTDIHGSEKVIFYGDSIQDAKAAIQTGVFFIGLYGYSADPDSLKYFCKQNNLLFFKSCLDISL